MKKLTVTKRMVLTFGLALTMMAIPVTSGVVTANAAGGDVAIDKAHFPDEAFREYVERFDEDEDGSLSREERAAVKEIDVEDSNIENLEGVAYFPNLTYLGCIGNKLTKLDVSKNKNLTELYCGVNELTKLDVSKNKNLTKLDCDNNKLTKLDVSNCKKLTSLDCYTNKLTKLDVSNCKKLRELDCDPNVKVIGYND